MILTTAKIFYIIIGLSIIVDVVPAAYENCLSIKDHGILWPQLLPNKVIKEYKCNIYFQNQNVKGNNLEVYMLSCLYNAHESKV